MKHVFPYEIGVKGYYDTLDECEELLFNSFGYPHGECSISVRYWYAGTIECGPLYQKYPCCSDLDYDAKEKFIQGISKWHSEIGKISKLSKEEYENEIFLLPHSHIGVWKISGYKKTGYDYGIQTFAFKNKEDLALFIMRVNPEYLYQRS